MSKEPELCIGCGQPVVITKNGSRRQCSNPDCDIIYYRVDRSTGKAYDIKRAVDVKEVKSQ